jgi:hypothetical protein
MKKSEVKKSLKKKFKNRLTDYGFKPLKHSLQKDYNGFFIDFMFSMVDIGNGFSSQFGIHCGFTLLDNIYNAAFKTQKRNLNIYAIHQGELYESQKYPILEYDLYTEEDVNIMVNQVMVYLENEALPYFEGINTLEKIEPIINKDPKPRQAVISLILAKLVDNPNYLELKKNYMNLLKNWPQYEKNQLETIVQYLDKYTREEIIKSVES